MKRFGVVFLCTIILGLLLPLSANANPFTEPRAGTLKKLRKAVRANNTKVIFKIMRSEAHDKSLTSIERSNALRKFQSRWKKGDELKTIFYTGGKFDEINKVCNDDDCEIISIFSYGNSSGVPQKRVNSRPFIKHVKKMKITCEFEKKDKYFNHCNYKPLEYFDSFDQAQFLRRSKEEKALSSNAVKKLVFLGNSKSSTDYGSTTYSGFWNHDKYGSTYVPERSESYVSGTTIKYKAINRLTSSSATISGIVKFKTPAGYLYGDDFSTSISVCRGIRGWSCVDIDEKNWSETFSVKVAPNSSETVYIYTKPIVYSNIFAKIYGQIDPKSVRASYSVKVH